MQLVTPSFHVEQDASFVHVSISCVDAKVAEVRIVAEERTFGCFVDPVYLPLYLPCAVESMSETCALTSSPHGTYDSKTQTFTVHIKKRVHGEHFPGLEALRPQLLSDDEMAQLEEASRQQGEHPYGLMSSHAPLSHAYAAMMRNGRVPILDIVDPTVVPLAERSMRAEELEIQKWDEGMYLDSYVDVDGEVAAAVHVVPALLRKYVPQGTEPAWVGPLPPTEQAQACLVQVVFAYLYEMHVSSDEASTESAWTICKLCRSLTCFSEPLPPGTDVQDVLRWSFRRALTYPLYRSWALCERICSDAHELFNLPDAKARILHMLRDMDAIFALAPTGTGLAEPMELALQLVWDAWLAPLEGWIHAASDNDIKAMASIWNARMSKDAVGTPGEWDLEAWESAAREAQEHGEGGFV